MRDLILASTTRKNSFSTFYQVYIALLLFVGLEYYIPTFVNIVSNNNTILFVHAFQIRQLRPRCSLHRSQTSKFIIPHLSSSSAKTWQLFEHPFGAPDPPLSTLIRIPDQFVLAATPENYIPLQDGQRLVCLGDVHGDYQALVDFLELAGVLEFCSEKQCVDDDDHDDDDDDESEDYAKNEECRDTFWNQQYSALPTTTTPVWTGNNTILVQCGDVLDRGSEELACYQLLAQLSHQAESQGGKVVCLYGNHEALNAMGLFQYATTDAEYENVVGKLVDDQLTEYFKCQPSTSPRAQLFQQHLQNAKSDDDKKSPVVSWRSQYVGNQPARWATYEPNGLLSRSLMANMKVAVQVGRTVCVHAGLTAEHLKENGGIEGLNNQAKAYILGDTLRNRVAYNNHGYYASLQQPWIDAERRQSTYINSIPKFLGGGIGASSPVWMRDYSSPADGPPRNTKALSMIEKALEELGDCDRMVMGHTVQSKINAALDGKAWRVDVGASRGVIAGTPEVLEVLNVNGTEVVSVLTKGGKIPGSERQIMAMAEFL